VAQPGPARSGRAGPGRRAARPVQGTSADTHNHTFHTTISLLSHSATAAQQSSMIGFQNVDSKGIVHNPGVQRWPDGGDRSAAQPPAGLQCI